MSDSTWTLIEMTNNLKKDIEATPVCSRSALESEKLSEALDVTSGHTLRYWLKVLMRLHLSVIWEKFIKSPRSKSILTRRLLPQS